MRLPAILALLSLVVATSSAAQDDVPLTPAIGVIPESLDFGCVEIMTCRNGSMTLFNDGDPGSILRITGLHVAGDGLSLVDPPPTPFTIPPAVGLTLEFCPPAPGPASGTLTIESDNAPNSPVDVGLAGFGNLPPACDPGGPYSGEVRQVIQFDGTASGDPDGSIVAYDWDFGDGGRAGGPLPAHRYETPGLFVITLAVVDDCGSRTECETTADISPLMHPMIGVDPAALHYGTCVPLGECVDLSIDLFNDVPDPLMILTVTDLTVTGDGFSLVSPPGLPIQIPGDGSVVTLAVRFCPTVTGAHAGVLTVTAPDALNSPLDVPLDGSGNLVPVCQAGGPYRGRVGDPVQFDGTASTDADGSVVSYEWEFGDGSGAGGSLPEHTYDTPGIFTVTLAVTDDCGARSECETTADIAPMAPAIGVNPSALYYGVCNPVGECVDLTIDLFNDAPDPLVILTVTDLAVTGDGFSLLSPPNLPLEIPGGGSTVTLTVRFCPAAPDWYAGTLTITAPDAINSPLEAPLAGGGPVAGSGNNPHVTLPLHALLTDAAPCNGYLPVDCLSTRPTVNVPPGTDIVAFLLVNNQSLLTGVQTAFEWPSSWQLRGSFWDCQPGQIQQVIPQDPGGPVAGTLSTAFDCLTTTDLVVIGRMFMRTGPEGCLTQVVPDHPCGIHVLDCDHRMNRVEPFEPRLGRICVDSGGIDACDLVISLKPATWGAIKHSFR